MYLKESKRTAVPLACLVRQNLQKNKLAYSSTIIANTQKELDCLGYKIETEKSSVPLFKTTLKRFCTHLRKLYEHRATSVQVAAGYVIHWCRLATSGLRNLNVKIPSFVLNLINNPGNLECQALPAN